MENKINIAELLKDCPKGMELDCTMYENCTFEGIEDVGYTEILVKIPNRQIRLTKEGCFTHNDKYAKCVIFPKGKTTWEGFQRPFEDGDVVVAEDAESFQLFLLRYLTHSEDDNSYDGYCYFGWDFQRNELFEKGKWGFNRLATEEEKSKLFQAIKDNGYKWNEETKTLEKLKFDITTLKPFDSRVLVREGKTDVWQPTFYGFFHKRNKRFYTTMCGTWRMCIPYNEDTKHLTGTTDDCDEYYKNWK